jgi:hypothetical protein
MSHARTRARYLFVGGLIFFIVSIITDHPAIIGLSVVLLVGALICHAREPKPSEKI